MAAGLNSCAGVIQTGLRLEGTRSCIQKASKVALPVLMHHSSLCIQEALTVPFAALIRGPQVRWIATPNLSLRPSMSAGASLEDLAMPTARRATRGNGFRVLRFRCFKKKNKGNKSNHRSCEPLPEMNTMDQQQKLQTAPKRKKLIVNHTSKCRLPCVHSISVESRTRRNMM